MECFRTVESLFELFLLFKTFGPAYDLGYFKEIDTTAGCLASLATVVAQIQFVNLPSEPSRPPLPNTRLLNSVFCLAQLLSHHSMYLSDQLVFFKRCISSCLQLIAGPRRQLAAMIMKCHSCLLSQLSV